MEVMIGNTQEMQPNSHLVVPARMKTLSIFWARAVLRKSLPRRYFPSTRMEMPTPSITTTS